MNPGGITEETGKAVGTFMDIMRSQPLALALVVMNFILLGYLFYSGSSALGARKETVDLIVAWQRDTEKLMANCVSKEIMQIVVDALERDRDLYRRLLPPLTPLPTPAPQSERPIHTLFQLPP